MDSQNKNLILATALSFLVILGWFLLFPPAPPEGGPDAVPTAGITAATGTPPDVAPTPPPVTGPGSDAGTAPSPAVPTAAADAPRIGIETPSVVGSISLTGGRIDELSLRRYRETLDAGSPLVSLLSPIGEPRSYYALFGWAPGGTLTYDDVPGPTTQWTADADATLTPQTPVTLRWDNGTGLTFTRTISIDDEYMFTIDQSVANETGAPVRLAPYGIVARHNEPEVANFFILHEGVVRMSDGQLQELDYDKMPDLDVVPREGAPADVIDVAQTGWIGFTDKYWMTSLVPTQGAPFTSVVKYVPGADIYQVEAREPAVDVASGATVTTSTRLFAGAKEWETLRGYQNDENIPGFLDSIDWGIFFFLTKPIFYLLHWLNIYIGNMGWSIIALTLCIKALLFPLAYKSYVSMAKMKELQPEMEKLKESAGGDRQKLQQGMMSLYKTNKVNPASGCLPILLQIPIFFSLYKVIFVTIELRHAAWLGWIRDLSAPDPSSILNLFGLIPWDTPGVGSLFHIFSLGVLPILLGVSMWMQQKLNPAPTDATQAMIFSFMPWVFMFMLGTFASGLVLYWIANNTITFTQQYLIMRSQGYRPDVFGNIRRGFARKKSDAK